MPHSSTTTMRQMRTRSLMITLYIICIVISCSNSSHGNTLVYPNETQFAHFSALMLISGHIVLNPIHYSAPFYRTDGKVLNVGEELWKETLPLKMGSRLYQLQGLKPDTWYEVKISYPASVCVSKTFNGVSLCCSAIPLWVP